MRKTILILAIAAVIALVVAAVLYWQVFPQKRVAPAEQTETEVIKTEGIKIDKEHPGPGGCTSVAECLEYCDIYSQECIHWYNAQSNP